jgi:hypothetical protein
LHSAFSECSFGDSFQVAKSSGSDGLTIIGDVFMVDFISAVIGEYLIAGFPLPLFSFSVIKILLFSNVR